MGTLTFANRVKETSTTTGTGTLSLAGAVTGFRTFVAGHGTGNDAIFMVESEDLTEWELVRGTVTDATPDTLSRDTVILSSNANALVSFTKALTVYSVAPAEWLPLLHTKGDLAASTGSAATRLAVGTDGQVLKALASEATGLVWGPATPLTTKGDLLAYSTADARLAIGADNTVLTADSNEATGMKWAAAGGGTPWHWWLAEAGIAYGATPAAFGTRNGHGQLCFDDSTVEQVVFQGIAHTDLGAGNLTLSIYWAAATATSGDVVWNAAFEELDPDVLDIDSDSFATAKEVTDTAPGTTGYVTKATITFTIVQADNLSAGSPFRLLIKRDATNGSDTLVGDACILRVALEQ